MKKLGLIGGTGPESTIIYYRELTSGVQQRLNREEFPPLVIESLSVFEVLGFCRRQDYDGLTAYLTKGLQNLAAAGAEFAAFTGITPHIMYEEAARRSPIPLVSMVETSCRYAAEKRYGKVALLGTMPTMNGGFFQDAFRACGITALTPDSAEKAYIAEKIESELEYGIVKAETQAGFKRIAERLIREEHAEAIVLGCTELPLAFDGISLPVEKLNVMQIHIGALIEEIISG